MKLTKRVVDAAEPPPKVAQAFIRDDQLLGFALRITRAGAKSFILEKRINGQVKRITLGRYPEITTEQARAKAQQMLGEIATGINPITKQKETNTRGITLQTVFEDYLVITP
jgi:hypothetical protein